MGKPQMDGREGGCQNNASSGWRRKCQSDRTRGDTILRILGKDSVTFSKNTKKGRKDGSPLICRHNIDKNAEVCWRSERAAQRRIRSVAVRRARKT